MSHKRRRKHRPDSRRWYYDGTKYELHPEQLANLEIVRAQRRSEAQARRKVIAGYLAAGRSITDVALLTGFHRTTVWRHARIILDPLLS